MSEQEVPGPGLPSDAPWLKDKKSAAIKEEKNWDELEGRRGAHKEIYRLTVWALRVGALILMSMIVVRIWHLLGSYDARWLKAEDVNAIDKMLFSGALGGLVLGHLKEIMKPLDK